MGPPRNEKLRKKVRDLYAQGFTYAAIGQAVGISRQRAQQIVRPPSMLFTRIRKRSKDKCEGCGIPLRLGDGHVHHKQVNGNLEDLANLLYLCRSCHRRQHGSEADGGTERKEGK